MFLFQIQKHVLNCPLKHLMTTAYNLYNSSIYGNSVGIYCLFCTGDSLGSRNDMPLYNWNRYNWLLCYKTLDLKLSRDTNLEAERGMLFVA